MNIVNKNLAVKKSLPLKEDSWVQGITALSESVCDGAHGKFALSNVNSEDQVYYPICLQQPNNFISLMDKHEVCIIESVFRIASCKQ